MNLPSASDRLRATYAAVDVEAISANVRGLKELAGTVQFCAVVKADGYGHGAVAVARAAREGGATMLAVALVEEAVVLRAAGIEQPILVLSEPPQGSEHVAVELDVIATVYSLSSVERLNAAAQKIGKSINVHIKVDSGMHRVGCTPTAAIDIAQAIMASSHVRHVGTFTHLAVADAPELGYTNEQLDRFDDFLTSMRAEGITPGVVHAANSAGTIAHPRARYDMVRCGIAIYGQAPDAALDPNAFGIHLRQAIRVVSQVSFVKVLEQGARASYGLRYAYDAQSVVATIPIGYADGIARRWSAVDGEVLIHGMRRRIGGRVTMDQIVIDCGPTSDPRSHVEIGDEVVLIGAQSGRDGADEISAWEMAQRLDTIAYEVTCGLTARLPRVYV